MQAFDNFIFHIDVQPDQSMLEKFSVKGWIASLYPIHDIRLMGVKDRCLLFQDRPDVVSAFPSHHFATGFSGQIEKEDITDGSIRVSFKVNGVVQTVSEALSPLPVAARWHERVAAQIIMSIAKLRLRSAKSQRARWNAALRLLLSEIWLHRNSLFRRSEGERLLALFAEHFPNAVVVQIGANDGVTGDPLTKLFDSTSWTGVLVEPIPYLYLRLIQRYQGRSGLAFEQTAISDYDGTITLYRLREEPGITPLWYQQLASIDRSVLLKHRVHIPDIEERLVEESVSVITLSKLLSLHSLQGLDLFVVDTEGHDYCILRQLDFHRYRPIVIVFEYQHLSKKDKEDAYSLLREQEYQWAETEEGDTFCWRFL